MKNNFARITAAEDGQDVGDAADRKKNHMSALGRKERAHDCILVKLKLVSAVSRCKPRRPYADDGEPSATH